MIEDDLMGYMLDSAVRRSAMKKDSRPVIRDELSEKEAMQVFEEMLDIFRKHNVSYKCAMCLSLALSEAFTTGAVELYRIEMNRP